MAVHYSFQGSFVNIELIPIFFQTALQGFHPAPLLALRTLKAETIAGLSNLTVNSLLSHFKDNNEWLVTGTHAVIQFSE